MAYRPSYRRIWTVDSGDDACEGRDYEETDERSGESGGGSEVIVDRFGDRSALIRGLVHTSFVSVSSGMCDVVVL